MHLGQFARTETPCHFSLNTDAKNEKKYGTPRPPCYDLGRIQLRNISAYVGVTDRLVSPSDVETTIKQLSVPVEQHIIRGQGVYFNHVGYITHKDCSRLVILPTLLDIARSEAQEESM